jgi:hypothetical protein
MLRRIGVRSPASKQAPWFHARSHRMRAMATLTGYVHPGASPLDALHEFMQHSFPRMHAGSLPLRMRL